MIHYIEKKLMLAYVNGMDTITGSSSRKNFKVKLKVLLCKLIPQTYKH